MKQAAKKTKRAAVVWRKNGGVHRLENMAAWESGRGWSASVERAPMDPVAMAFELRSLAAAKSAALELAKLVAKWGRVKL